MRARDAWVSVRALLASPRTVPAAIRQARRLVPTGWWRRPPFLPLPDRSWMRFRMTTAYGDPAAPVDGHDLVTWLDWTDTVRSAEGPRRGAGASRRPAPPPGNPRAGTPEQG